MSVRFSKTKVDTDGALTPIEGLVFSPWEIRPGVNVTITYDYVEEFGDSSWDSSQPITIVTTGIVFPTSIKAPGAIIPAANISISTDQSTVTIQPINAGAVDITVFAKKVDVITSTSRPAITETDSRFFNDFIIDQFGNIVPETVVPVTLKANTMEYKPTDFRISVTQRQRGVSVLNGDTWTSNEVGALKMIDNTDDFSMSRNLFRKGLTEVRVPIAFPIKAKRRIFEGNAEVAKTVDIDLQDWVEDTVKEVRGILWHRDFLYVLTNEGLYSFDRFKDFSVPDNYYPGVTGTDLTYGVTDRFLVTDITGLKEYKVRHDFIFVAPDTGDLVTREGNPIFSIEE